MPGNCQTSLIAANLIKLQLMSISSLSHFAVSLFPVLENYLDEWWNINNKSKQGDDYMGNRFYSPAIDTLIYLFKNLQ